MNQHNEESCFSPLKTIQNYLDPDPHVVWGCLIIFQVGLERLLPLLGLVMKRNPFLAPWQEKFVAFKAKMTTQNYVHIYYIIQLYIWVVPKIGVPQNGWLIRENPIRIDDLGYHYFRKHPYCINKRYQMCSFITSFTDVLLNQPVRNCWNLKTPKKWRFPKSCGKFRSWPFFWGGKWT